MPDSKVPFYYPLGPTEIRLLRFTTRSKQENIQCELKTVDLEGSLPPYFTLSYVWGKPNFSQQIEVNDMPFLITPNLLELMRGMHSPKLDFLQEDDPAASTEQRGWFWVDAICIDQTNLPERGSQVALMSEIYSRTRFTMAWLGGEADDSDKAFKLADELAHAADDGVIEETVQKLAWDSSRKGCWAALDALLRRPWWSRIWIKQECVLPGDYYLVCGEVFLPDMAVTCLAYCLYSSFNFYSTTWAKIEKAPNVNPTGFVNERLIAKTPGYQGAINIHEFRVARNENQGMPLLDIMRQLRDAQATDERDMLYGITGLSCDGAELLGTPDYFVPPYQVVSRLVQSFVEMNGNLDIICLAVTPRKGDPNWPSWVPNLLRPDWRECSLAQIRVIHMRQHARSITNPDVDYPMPKLYNASCGRLPQLSFSGNTMTASGLIVDVIDGLGWAENDDSWYRILQPSAPCNTVADPNTDKARDQVMEALFRAEVGDREQNQPVDASLRLVYERLCVSTFADRDSSVSAAKCIRENGPFMIRGRTLADWVALSSEKPADESDYAPAGSDAASYLLNISATQYLARKRLMVTKAGRIGMVPHSAARGDLVCVLLGCSLPVVLRRLPENFRFVGEAFLQDFMDGQAITELDAGTRHQEQFCMV